MPIITVQRRMAEQGRIRLGQKITGTTKQGKEYTRPAKLDRFRFTSPSQRLIEEIAGKYGGTARPWDNDGKAEWEVISDATAIPVIVVKGGFSQWHEHFTRAGLQHRCDGEKDPAGVFCNPDDPFHIEAIKKPTTRLSVMLEEIETLGVWRMESHGWNAAAELPTMAELAMHVGELVPATLSLAERTSVVQTDQGPQTSRYVVPALDLHVTKRQLVEIVSGQTAATAINGAQERQAITAGPTAGPFPEAPGLDDIQAATDVDTVRAIWKDLHAAGALTPELDAACKARAQELTPAEEPAAAEEPVAAELVDDGGPDADAVWRQILEVAGTVPMTETQLRKDFAAKAGVSPDQASAGELTAYLAGLREQVAA